MSSAGPPEFFLDRSLGKGTARLLREQGHVVHLIAEHYPDDAQEIPDTEWIDEGCRLGWVLLTKDKRIRYRANELKALDGHLFCLVTGNSTVAEMAEVLIAAIPRITRAAAAHERGFWHIHSDGSIRKMWP